MFWKRKKNPKERPLGPHVKFTEAGEVYVDKEDFFSDPRFKATMEEIGELREIARKETKAQK